MADKSSKIGANYDEIKAKLKEFLSGYHKINDQGQKEFTYARVITAVAHRDQVFNFFLPDLHSFNFLLASRRMSSLS